ncbi:MAG TPA: TonB-dependent receptor, partial [Arenimonas sp.]|nr:TonB-dependent receptor [Arenimonas sp.]
GIINVLHGDEARLLGARTALEALTMVPGIDVNRDQYGSPALRVRGVDFFFNNGNIKVLIDGLPISREAAGQNGAVLLMPIEQIERIELIRGPGTGVHGDFAFMGLVNLVTRHQGKGISVSVGRGSRRSLMAHFADASQSGDWRLSGNLSDWQSDRFDTSDALDNDEQRRMLSLQLGWKRLDLQLAAIDRDWQGWVPNRGGANQPPPPSPIRENLQIERSHNLQLRYRLRDREDERAALWLQRRHNVYERQNAQFEGPRSEIGGEWLRRFGRHQWLLQVQWARLEVERASLPGPPPAMIVRDSRALRSLSVQDQIDFGAGFQLTAGLRYDSLQDVDSKLTPRLAAIWQINPRHLLKAQYSEGFRSPGPVDGVYSGSTVESQAFEQVQTRELGYVYRRPQFLLRVTGFSNRISHMFFPPGNRFFGQDLGVRAQGLEFELSHQPISWLKWQATWSTANAFDDRAAVVNVPGQGPVSFGGASVGQPESLGNLALLFNPDGAWSAGMHWQHVGRRADRGQAGFQPGYQQLNLGLRYQPATLPKLRVDWGLRNALADDVYYIETRPGMPLQLNRYAEREWSLGVSWSFD